jgi:ParB family chromosome partitioning protein
MTNIVYTDPSHCRMWAAHERLQLELTEDNCRTEIESFSKNGQLLPVLGRPLSGNQTHKIELIYGARRLFVAKHLNRALLIELRNCSDRDAFVAMDIENRQRREVSPYERGLSYAQWIRSGHFKSQDDLARVLNVSESQVSRLLKIAQLPSAIIGAFENSTEIHEEWGLDLAEAIKDPVRRQRTLAAGRAISGRAERPPACEVFRQLLCAAARGRKVRPGSHDEVVKDKHGNPLFRIEHRRSSIAVVLETDQISKESITRIRDAIAEVLKRASEQGLSLESRALAETRAQRRYNGDGRFGATDSAFVARV